MPRKQTFANCLFFNGNHYSIPIGKMDQSPEGDGYLGYGEEGEYISFHNSGQVHYKNENGKLTILNRIGSNELLIEFFKETLEPFQDMSSPERKFFIKLIEKTESSFSDNGCFDAKCKNKAGMAINFDKLMELTDEYLNQNKKLFFQLYGPIENS